MMTEHEQNLHDLAAMLAMVALLMRGEPSTFAVTESFEIANKFLTVRQEKQNA
jgi:hypothetical protein